MKTATNIPVCTALLFGFLVGVSNAQQFSAPADRPQAATVDSTTGNPSTIPQLKINPLRALEQSEPAIGEAYELGAGDTIKLYVAGHPELSRDYIVGPDGLITIDVAGSVKVSDLSREAAAKVVRDTLAAYYTEPAVTIGVEKYGSNSVMIFGNIQHPGILPYEGTTPTLLDAIGRGGLLTNPSSTDGLPERCTIYRGSDTVLQVQLDDLLRSSSPLSDIRLRRGDKIFIPIDRQQFVSVLGQVGKPGPVAITPGFDLKMALTQAGGLKDEAGDNPTVHIIQTASNRELNISYKQLMTPGGGSEVTLRAGDVISIPRSGFNKFGYVLTKLSPALTMISLAALVAH
ncbi:MAG: polysaccharide biosynthesis/export family protein [Acidobacteriota bacterium]|nr:polysaccharide biosynthesis/export family protein [Acidobacteriota bacterium]